MLTNNWPLRNIGPGVLPPSQLYDNTVSRFAAAHLYYAKRIGDYHCNKAYLVDRTPPEKRARIFYAAFILSGQLHVEYRGTSFIADPGSILLLDCRQPNRYFCTGHLHYVWAVLDGSATEAYFRLLTARSIPLFHLRSFSALVSRILSIGQDMENQTENIHLSACFWHELLATLACEEDQQYTDAKSRVEQLALPYIREHFAEKLTVEALAEHCCLSVSHFIRVFRQTQNCTPHEYIINTRLHHSAQLLLSTELSVDEISAETGFCSASHFTSAFRAHYGVTPLQYRAALPL